MNRVCSIRKGVIRNFTEFYLERLKARVHSKDVVVDGTIILKCILEK
jgi:hypothetical protein